MVFQFPLLNSLILPFISLFICIVGLIIILKKQIVPGGIILILGLLFGIIFGPLLFADKVVVDDLGIMQKTGFWFNPTIKGLEFEDLNEILITIEKNENDFPALIWYGKYSTEKVKRVDPGDLWEDNIAEIVQYIRKLGINVIVDRKNL